MVRRPWLGNYFGPWLLRVLGVELPERPTIELIGGANVTISAVDDPETDATKVTISATGGGGPGGIVDVDHGGTDLTVADLAGHARAAIVVNPDEDGYTFRPLPTGDILSNSSTDEVINKTINGALNTLSNIPGSAVLPDFGSQNVVTTGKMQPGYIGPSGAPSTGGFMRFGYSASEQELLTAEWSANNKVPLIRQTGATTRIGSLTLAVINLEAFTLSLTGGAGGLALNAGGGSGTTVLRSDGTTLRAAVPLAGSANESMPFRLKPATITQSSTADTTLSASQAECPVLEVNGTPGGAFNVIGPNVSGARYEITNTTPSPLTIKKSGGTGVTIAAGKSAIVRHNGTDYIRITPDA